MNRFDQLAKKLEAYCLDEGWDCESVSAHSIVKILKIMGEEPLDLKELEEMERRLDICQSCRCTGFMEKPVNINDTIRYSVEACDNCERCYDDSGCPYSAKEKAIENAEKFGMNVDKNGMVIDVF